MQWRCVLFHHPFPPPCGVRNTSPGVCNSLDFPLNSFFSFGTICVGQCSATSQLFQGRTWGAWLRPAFILTFRSNSEVQRSQIGKWIFVVEFKSQSSSEHRLPCASCLTAASLHCRASEGRSVELDYRGDVNVTVKDILGGLRSTCTYVGAAKLKELSRRTTFIRVTQQTNEVYARR